MLEIKDHRKQKQSRWPTMLLSQLHSFIQPYKFPFDEELTTPKIMDVYFACKSFLENLLVTDQRHFRRLPDLRRNEEDTVLKIYDSYGNLIFEVVEKKEENQEPTRIYGYARVSGKRQKPELQIEAMKKLKCDEIVIEKISAFAPERPLFNNLLGRLKKGDTLVVWNLSRLGRGMFDLFKIMAHLQKEEVIFVSITENIDTSTTTGRIMFSFLSIMGEYEAELLKERTEAGKEVARANGKTAGRPKGITEATRSKTKAISDMYLAKNQDNTFKYSANEIARILNISKKTVYKGLQIEGVQIGNRTNLFK